MPADDAQRRSDFEQLVREIGTGLLTSHNPDGSLHTRPLQTLRVSRDALCFSTDRCSPKTAKVWGDLHVSVGYADTGPHWFAAVSGVGRLHHDHDLAQKLWQLDQRVLPRGPGRQPAGGAGGRHRALGILAGSGSRCVLPRGHSVRR